MSLLVAAGTFCAVSAAVVGVANASDSKTYNGSFCRSVASSGTVGYQPDGTVENGHNSESATVLCPISRDNTQNASGWNSIIVGIFDRNPLADREVECTAYARGTDGTEVWSEPGSSSGSLAFGWSSFTLDDPAAASEIDGYYYMLCTLPDRDLGSITVDKAEPSGVAFYRVEEP